ncbi:MAG: DNA topology modulation protein [Clostridia bacterium]|nr:DNA topology modulation protein [Clostridia bacterium]
MKKIAVIGCSGSGKSLISQFLNKKLDIPVYHLDSLFWKANWVPTPQEEWDTIQKELVKKEKWIIDGNYAGTLDIRLSEADTVIFFDLPRYICMFRIFKRYFQYRNTTRPDMSADCEEKIDLEFVKWVWHFNKTQRPEVLKKLEFYSEKNIMILKTKKEVSRFMASIV